MGCLPEVGSPDVLRHVEAVVTACKAHRENSGPPTHYRDLMFQQGTPEFDAALGRLKDHRTVF